MQPQITHVSAAFSDLHQNFIINNSVEGNMKLPNRPNYCVIFG